MTNAGPDRRPIDEALARFLDGETEPGDGEFLAAAMRDDEGFAREVRRLLTVDDLLRQDAMRDDRSFLEAVELRLAGTRDGTDFLERLDRRLRRGGPTAIPLRPRAIAGLAAAAACVVAAFGLGFGLGFRPGRDRAAATGGGVAAAARPTAPGRPTEAEAVVALLVNEADARFAGNAAPRAVRFGVGAYQQTEGTVHLRFTSGADVVIRAPARYEIRDPMHVAVTEGILRAIVPDSAHGFTIEAPGVDYEDLGTEFGVAVAPSGRAESELHVFEGRVDLKSPAGELLARVRLGESVRVVEGAVEPESPADLDRFPSPGAIGFQRWDHWRRTFRADPSLVCYYPFVEDPKDDRLLSDDAAPGPGVPGRIRGARWVSGRWSGKQALLFDRDEDAVELALPGEFRQLTAAAWLNLDRLDFVHNAILDSDGWSPGDFHWQLTRSGEERAGVFDFNREKTVRVGSTIPLGQWVHLAAVVDLDRDVVRVFLDGELFEEVSSPRPQPGLTLAPGRCLIGNWSRRPDWRDSPDRGFRGRIDEFAVWRRALSRDEIRAIAKAGWPSLLNAVGPPGSP